MRYVYNLYNLIRSRLNPARVSLLETPNPQEVVRQLEAINHRLEADEIKAEDRIFQKQNCCKSLFYALCTGGIFVGVSFLTATIRHYNSLAAQEQDNFYNLPTNSSTCHSLYPEINKLKHCCDWSIGISCIEVDFVSFCSNIVNSYCGYKEIANFGIMGAVFISLIGAVGGIAFVAYLCGALRRERLDYIDFNEVPNETLTCREKIFLMFQGISYHNTQTSDVKTQSTYRQIVLRIGTERHDLYTLFGTLVKDYSANPGNDPEYIPDAYNLCSQFPGN